MFRTHAVLSVALSAFILWEWVVVMPACPSDVIDHNTAIEYLEVAWDIDTVGARHTVVAHRAGNWP